MREFPYVECDGHPGKREPGYVVCFHVSLAQEPIGHFERATPDNLGTICCAGCYSRLLDIKDTRITEDLILCCAQCLREKGLLASA